MYIPPLYGATLRNEIFMCALPGKYILHNL